MKNKLLRKALSLGVVMSVFMIQSAIAIASEDTSKEINTISKLEKCLDQITKDNIVTSAERNKLKSRLDLNVAKEYIAQYNDEIEKVINTKKGEKNYRHI
ncbi:hypothetical protein [[Clostridium] polysaccharolyticum]|uniref:Uncharacterized protein n=1 Tax=[Clostridium] polysaccharolyticum TaxID=29364 RepID=A0A1I0BNM0_9FIRM|nr:hypothetical protein [[Clostridium] polysaccharolyticum]SET08616.1 hypothetical protein SAMN04487772_10834 [[Clostridium] polysaccharolyticum]